MQVLQRLSVYSLVDSNDFLSLYYLVDSATPYSMEIKVFSMRSNRACSTEHRGSWFYQTFFRVWAEKCWRYNWIGLLLSTNKLAICVGSCNKLQWCCWKWRQKSRWRVYHNTTLVPAHHWSPHLWQKLVNLAVVTSVATIHFADDARGLFVGTASSSQLATVGRGHVPAGDSKASNDLTFEECGPNVWPSRPESASRSRRRSTFAACEQTRFFLFLYSPASFTQPLMLSWTCIDIDFITSIFCVFHRLGEMIFRNSLGRIRLINLDQTTRQRHLENCLM